MLRNLNIPHTHTHTLRVSSKYVLALQLFIGTISVNCEERDEEHDEERDEERDEEAERCVS